MVMLGEDADVESSDQRVAVLDAIARTQQLIAKKRAEDLASAGLVEAVDGSSSAGSSGWSTPRVRVGFIGARSDRGEFFSLWSRKIDAFVSDQGKTALELPSDLSANDRRELHSLAEKFNLSHVSEGSGVDRRLVLRKDALFYKAPQVRPKDEELEKLKAQPQQRPGVSASGAKTVESRFELRRVRHREDEVKYADEDAEKALRRLARATDHYRNAVEVGMSMEEMQAHEQGNTVELVLQRSSAAPSATTTATLATTQQWQSTLSNAQRHEELVADDGSTRIKSYDEQCVKCGTRVPLTYELSAWTCSGFCDACRRETIWRLVETVEPLPKEAIERDDDVGEPPAKHPRVDVEAITKDEDMEEDALSLGDAIDLLTMNDAPRPDIAMVQTFAEALGADVIASSLHKFLFFFLELDSLADGSVSSFTRGSGPATVYIRATGIQQAAVLSVSATDIAVRAVDAVCAARFCDVVAARRVKVAMPSASLCGTSLTTVIRCDQVAITDAELQEAVKPLLSLYGGRHLRVGRRVADVL